MVWLLAIIAVLLLLLVLANPEAAEGLGCLLECLLRLTLIAIGIAAIIFFFVLMTV